MSPEVPMVRLLAAALALFAATAIASAQVGVFPQVGPPVPSPGGAPPVPQPVPVPPMPPSFHAPSTSVTVPGLPTVQVPSGPPNRNSFGDRVERCIQAGTAAGIGPNDIGGFTRQCAN